MKKGRLWVLAIIVVSSLLWVLLRLWQSWPMEAPFAGRGALSVSNRVSHTDTVSDLQQLGHVPEGDHDHNDWQRAQHTTWWGKPLDPKEFWRGRVFWNDEKATSDAQRHGRLYPPMPYIDTNLTSYPNDEGIHGGYLSDSANISYGYSSTERAFWEKFDRTHPRPPNQIKTEQEINVQDLNDFNEAYLQTHVIANNYPPEAFTKDALFWAYVQMKRSRYQQLLDQGDKTNEPVFLNLMSDLAVDPKLVTEPLSPEQIHSANAWKVSYLQRLKNENVDGSYISGYMQVWNLSPEQVFPSGR